MPLSPRRPSPTGSGAHPPPPSPRLRTILPLSDALSPPPTPQTRPCSVECAHDCDCGVNQRCGIPTKKEDQVAALLPEHPLAWLRPARWCRVQAACHGGACSLLKTWQTTAPFSSENGAVGGWRKCFLHPRARARALSFSLSLSHTHTHTHARSLSLSLSLSHTHTHTHTRSLSVSLFLSLGLSLSLPLSRYLPLAVSFPLSTCILVAFIQRLRAKREREREREARDRHQVTSPVLSTRSYTGLYRGM